jgi:hypothetical protein
VSSFIATLAAGGFFTADAATQEAAPASTILVRAEWHPVADSKYRVIEDDPAVRALFSRGPDVVEARHDLSEWFLELASNPETKVGDVFAIDAEELLPLLRQIHPGATTRFRSGVQAPGAFACLRAATDDVMVFVVRVHGEFELLPGRVHMIPAQFTGELVLDRTTAECRWLELALPDRNTNFDVNVRDRVSGTTIADIGHIPVMRLTAGDRAVLTPELAACGVPLGEANVKLRQAFYRYAEAEFLSFPEAVAASAFLGRPLHLLILFGTLDDESC